MAASSLTSFSSWQELQPSARVRLGMSCDALLIQVTRKLQDVDPHQEMVAAFQELDPGKTGLLPLDDVITFLTNHGEVMTTADVGSLSPHHHCH